MSINDKDRLLTELLEQKTQEFNNLRTQIARLQERGQMLEQDIAAINHLQKSAQRLETKSAPAVRRLPSGFRDAVRTVMKEFPGGMTNAEIRKHMTSRGYKYEFETPFGIRMGNELARMKHQGQIRKDGKKYILTEKGRAM